MVVDILAATHHVDSKTKILVQGTAVEGHILRLTGRWMIILTLIGGAGSTWCQMAVMAIVDRSKPIQSDVISST